MPNMRTTSVFGDDSPAAHEMRLGLIWLLGRGGEPRAGRAGLDLDQALALERALKGGSYDDGLLTTPGARGEPPQYLAHMSATYATAAEQEAAWTHSAAEDHAEAFRDWIVLFDLDR